MPRHRSIDADLALQARRRLQSALGSRPLGARDTDDDDDATTAETSSASPDLDELVATPVRVGSGRRFDRSHLAVVAVLALVGLAVTAVLVLRARPVTMVAPTTIETVASSVRPTPIATRTPSATAAPISSAPPLVIHVVGAVRRPGLVELPAGSRVADALAAAGGLTPRADPGELNLAQPLADGQQVVIVSRAASQRDPPEVSEVRQPGTGGTGTGTGTTGGAPDGSGAPVDLNAATEAELDELPGVGPVTAAAILAWRDEHGRFTDVAELQEVDGIGPKTYADLAPLVRV